eukprot:CAMPEP_0113643416 /NCGR_PEP_ID=MMETSP0017_2-20120614/22828_1 /TAXON_ID=2856 /ORGANISM="Cylindrotheca closterium" /LENGTH=1103 /DNA_ID=CAMNT_0000554929 /DNA_START=181 /DNA_END=3489 /DNA_ORIENTATION=+ /assembly_acc=CAM_ASM_000147
MSEPAAASHADDKKAEKPPVDNATLAFMLRESADIVEKGEFDVILYHALQDFRTYYKLHLPKRKDKSKKKPAAAAATTAAAAAATATAGSVENSSDAPAAASSDAQKEASTKPAETTGEATTPAASADPPSEPTPVQQPKPDAPAREISAGATEISEGTASTTPSTTDPPTSSSSKPQGDAPESAATEPGDEEKPINAESGRMGSVDSILDSGGRAGEDFANESSSVRDAQSRQNHSSFAPFGKKAKNAGSKISAGMFATKTKMKLPKKLPKIHVNLPSSGKKKRESELADVTGGDVAQYAESSRRRTAADGEDGNEYHYHYDAEMQSPQRSTNLKPAVTGLGNSEIPSTAATTPVDRVREDEPAESETEKPSSLRNNETDNAASNNTAAVQEAEPTAPTSSVPSTATSSDAFVADPRPESFDFEMPDHGHSKPAFQRPKNKNSAVVANGWIEQQRRSKMRTVWKEVLASLVQGRRPGEETTLWIQRETVDATTGKKELEALHQIPVKLLESVVYSEYTTDDRFSLKLYHSHEEFVFRCNNDPSGAMNWVTILQQFEMETKQNGSMPPAPTESIFPDFPEEKKGSDMPERSSSPTPTRLAIRDLRAICHGAGINTAGMERADLERAAAEVQQRGTFFAPPSAGHAAAASVPLAAGAPGPAAGGVGSTTTSRSASPIPVRPSEPSAPASNGATSTKMSIKDLRAICHGAGISTVGMERGELEKAAAEVQSRGTYFAPPAAAPTTAPRPAADAKPEDDAAKQEEMRRRQAAEDEARRKAAEEEHWRRHEEETRRRAAEDEHRRRAEEEHRRRAAEEEHRRRVAEQQARQAEDQRRRYAEQQAAWQHQQQQEEQRRRMAEQQAAEQRRRHEEAVRKQQQWAGQQPQAQAHQQQGWSRQQPHPHHPQQHYQHPPQQPHAPHHQQQWQQQQQQQWHQQQQQQHPHYQQQQQQQARPQAPPSQQHPPQQQSKYAKMANQTDDDGQAAITKLKHDILIQWALQPPNMQMLRSVDVLLSTIQTVFPPALGVPAHDYFKKWKVVTRESVLSDAGIIDEEKVKKAVRKLRFFLHPDKLPKDLNKEQEFMVKMLWDITNDAWEEYQKSKEHLDW